MELYYNRKLKTGPKRQAISGGHFHESFEELLFIAIYNLSSFFNENCFERTSRSQMTGLVVELTATIKQHKNFVHFLLTLQ